MSEKAPDPIPTPEEPKEQIPNKYDHINDIYTESRDDFYKNQKEAERIAAIEESIKNTPNRAQNAPTKEVTGTTFETTKKAKTASFIKKAMLWGGLTLGLSSAAKEAKAQQNIHTDKEGAKKEVVISSKQFELSDSTKKTFDNYRSWYWNYVKEHHIDTRDLQTREMAKSMMDRYNKETKGPHITEEIVGEVQDFFIGYRKLLLKAYKDGKVEIEGADTTGFMDEISVKDGIAGVQTMSLEIPKGIEKITQRVTARGPDIKGQPTELLVSTSTETKQEGYVNTAKYDDK